tara:strand:+ start:323 stop:823 length:501 start_codon:yes stop_codon:yes gene_type:complete
MNNVSYLSIGTNLGDKKVNISIAHTFLDNNEKIKILSKSNIYLTTPLYNLDQDDFYNNVIKIKTSLNALDLLYECQNIEKKMGRKSEKKRNMPRVIDIDIITYNDEVFHSKDLTLPHPKLYERKFVLIPMHEIDSEFIFPNKKSINELLNIIEDSSKIIKLDKLKL